MGRRQGGEGGEGEAMRGGKRWGDEEGMGRGEVEEEGEEMRRRERRWGK